MDKPEPQELPLPKGWRRMRVAEANVKAHEKSGWRLSYWIHERDKDGNRVHTAMMVKVDA